MEVNRKIDEIKSDLYECELIKKNIEIRGLKKSNENLLNMINSLRKIKDPVLSEYDVTNIVYAFYDTIYIELKKDLDRIALILEGLLKEVKNK